MLIDTNIILEIALGQKNSEECKKLIKAIKNYQIDENIYLTRFTLNAIQAYCKKEKVKFLRDLLLMIYQGMIRLIEGDIQDDLMINSVRTELGLDFDDATQFIAAQKTGTYLVTYDNDFQDKPIQTKTPKQVLEKIFK